jgi:hypothetical protein
MIVYLFVTLLGAMVGGVLMYLSVSRRVRGKIVFGSRYYIPSYDGARKRSGLGASHHSCISVGLSPNNQAHRPRTPRSGHQTSYVQRSGAAKGSAGSGWRVRLLFLVRLLRLWTVLRLHPLGRLFRVQKER